MARKDEESADFWPAFIGGLTQPSLPALVLTLGVAVVLVGGLLVFGTPTAMVAAAPYIAEEPTDVYPWITGRAIELSESASKEPTVLFLGTSAIQQALVPVDEIANILTPRCGFRPRVIDLTMGAQTFWEINGFAEMLPSGFRGVVLVGVNPWQLALDPKYIEEVIRTPRLGFRTAAFDEEVQRAGYEMPARTGNYVLDNRRYFYARLPSLWRNLVRGPVKPMRRRYRQTPDGASWKNEALWKKMSTHFPEFAATLDDHRGTHLAVLRRAIDRLRARDGVGVVLLNCPANPRFLDLLPADTYASYMQGMHEYAADAGVEFWDFNTAAGLQPDDYDDYCHLRFSDARQRFCEALAPGVARILKEQSGE